MDGVSRERLLPTLLLAFTAWLSGGVVAQEAPGPTAASPGKIYSAEEIASLFQRPTTLRQLLQNIKLAADRDLPLQPNFYADSVLTKLFAGKSVARAPLSNMTDGTVEIDDPHFPHMTVWFREGTMSAVSATQSDRRFGTLKMDVGDVPGCTVSLVLDVFGPHPLLRGGTGYNPHGTPPPPDRKGYIEYPYYGDETATPDPPYSRRYGSKTLIFGVKLDSDSSHTPAAPSEPPLPHSRLFSRDEVRDIRITIQAS
jgi:hypothetical protein